MATTPKDAISTPSSLAAALAIAPSSMTHRLDKMSERGLILRTPDTTNRTRMIVTLTSAGWEMFRKTIQAGDVVESDVLAQLSETERETLADLLERAIAGLDDALGS
ncbi:MarR family winged helix-turn-helix transcriptional regulator [Branchiibius cervicis]|uniref:MarR family winged helix-turn-helix transcriptional regulator n=1 Tax=Branchiibius cervicis TaxID=908252 RepID=A0ABW2AQI6_9MICO